MNSTEIHDHASEPTQTLLNARISATVEKIRRALGLSLLDYCEILGLRPEDYKRISGAHGEFKLYHLVSLSDALSLNLNLIFSGKIDYTALASSFHSGKLLFPEKYALPTHQLARVRTVQGIISFLEKSAGLDYTDQILGRLQIKSSHFAHPDDFTSPILIQDLLHELQTDGYSDLQIREMGIASLWVNQKAEMGRHFSKMKSQNELYRSSCEELIGNFDRVWNYRLLSLKNDHCLIEVRPKSDSHDIFHSQIIGSRDVCVCRQGVIQSFPGFLGQGIAKLTEHECMYDGSNRCLYRVDWSHLPKHPITPQHDLLLFRPERLPGIRLHSDISRNRNERSPLIALHA